jgi:alanyl-tRNA synthetase
MKSADIRQAFLEYFKKHGHTVVASSSLVPANDPTLLFTNAGMVQFKDVFLGKDARDYVRAASSQRCVRAGGKHNDLDNVGYTARHHTFFEMLGNFSFGDYFKREAINFAWNFLTQELKLPKEKLWVTVYKDDKEAESIWLNEIGADAKRFSRLGDSSNFWSMGDTGPCGPCTEIFYDHGEDIAGGPPGSPDEDGDRYIEIWNLVFMQYDRASDGTLTPLPKPSVDTGMGIERIAAVMQGVHSNYEIDLFQSLIRAAVTVLNCKDAHHASLKVIADHIRSCSFLIADGVVPSNEGRGYVLRRIIRRAVRHGNSLGATEPFFYKLVKALALEMGDAYPELKKSQAHIEKILLGEEQQFAKTIDQGMKILEQAIADLKGTKISGETVFKLYDTYGFPADLTADVARERKLTIDEAGFEREMQVQRERARGASNFEMQQTKSLQLEGKTDFVGYDTCEKQSRIVALYKKGESVGSVSSGDDVLVVLDHSPFYGESGGQVGDTGVLISNNGRINIRDTKKENNHHLHYGAVVSGSFAVGDNLTAQVDEARRAATVLNHSATHLLHAALRNVLGDHVAQKGSLVAPDRLRFDFSHFEAITPEQLKLIEKSVNDQIRINTDVHVAVMDMDAAKQQGAMALFGEKYGKEVRVLSMGDGFSVELCGGTHAKRTGDIGLFKIISEAGIAAGVRRIEAVTGQAALAWVDELDNTLKDVARLFKTSRDHVQDKIQQLMERNRGLEKELEQIKSKMASSAGDDLINQAQDINGVKVLAAMLEGVDPKSLRDMVDQLKNKLHTAAVVLATISDGKVSLVAGVTSDTMQKVKAGELANMVASQVGGKGGGRPDMAQAGGTNPDALPTALASVPTWVAEQLR